MFYIRYVRNLLSLTNLYEKYKSGYFLFKYSRLVLKIVNMFTIKHGYKVTHAYKEDYF